MTKTTENFNVMEVLMKVGYTETGAKSQKTSLLKKAMNTEITLEVKDIEEVERETMIKVLAHIGSGKGKYVQGACDVLTEMGEDVQNVVKTSKTVNKKNPTCKELKELIDQQAKQIEELSQMVKELMEKLK